MRSLIDFLLPRFCLSCSTPLRGEVRPWPLCDSCRSRLTPVEGRRCRGCGRRLPEPLSLCGACTGSQPPFDHLVAGWHFEPPLADVLRAFKFGRLEGLGNGLARAMVPILETHWGQHGGAIDLVVPVPLHPWRRLKRGYNQAERIARPLARLLAKPCRQPLRRRRATLPQARLDRKRRQENLDSAFSLRWGARVEGQRILLVDDVITTGATLRAAAKTLRDAGCGSVLAVAVARTPEVTRGPRKFGNNHRGPGV